jgi:hypothetical protein
MRFKANSSARPARRVPNGYGRSIGYDLPKNTAIRRLIGLRNLMPDELRSPIKHHLVLHRIDPEQGIRRFYSLMIERDLFGTVRLMRNWVGSAPSVRRKPRSSPTKTRLVEPWRPWLKRCGGRATGAYDFR